jgi:hypothetical protein
MSDGARQSAEVSAGSGYYSQSTPDCFFGWLDANPPRTVGVRWPSGDASEAPVLPGKTAVELTAP